MSARSTLYDENSAKVDNLLELFNKSKKFLEITMNFKASAVKGFIDDDMGILDTYFQSVQSFIDDLDSMIDKVENVQRRLNANNAWSKE